MLDPFVRRYFKRAVACGLIFALYLAARLPTISSTERARLAAQFRFVQTPLPVVPGPEIRSVRPVNPSIQHIAGWISTVGAGVALADIDGDGLPNDLCYVDVRTDQVIVAPVPGTGPRYKPFTLDPGPRLFDRSTMAPMGCLPGDMNEDGRMDLLVYYWGRTPLAFLQNADRTFTATEIVPNERWFTNAATFADLDGDGHPDSFLGSLGLHRSTALQAQLLAPPKATTEKDRSRRHAAPGSAEGDHANLFQFQQTGKSFSPADGFAAGAKRRSRQMP